MFKLSYCIFSTELFRIFLKKIKVLCYLYGKLPYFYNFSKCSIMSISFAFLRLFYFTAGIKFAIIKELLSFRFWVLVFSNWVLVFPNWVLAFLTDWVFNKTTKKALFFTVVCHRQSYQTENQSKNKDSP